MATNQREHTCISKPYGALVEFNKRRKQWILTLTHKVTEGKLNPKVYFVEYAIKFCPFCGEDLHKEGTPHLESCDCIICKSKNLFDNQVKLKSEVRNSSQP